MLSYLEQTFFHLQHIWQEVLATEQVATAVSWIKVLVAYWGPAILVLDAYARIRNQGSWSWLWPLDKPARAFNDVLHGRSYYPGDSFPNYIPELEKEFYDEFSHRLRKAKKEVYLSGDGYDMSSRAKEKGNFESADRADIVDAAIIKAMEQNQDLQFTRFQIRSVCLINWLSRLIFMKETFPRRFRVILNPTYDHLGCFCAIDPESYRCVFEWQVLSARRFLGGHKHKGFGFIYTNQSICRKLVSIFDKIEEKGWNMSASDLRNLQRTLWDERVDRMRREIEADPAYRPLDPEMWDRWTKNSKAMEFRPKEFPSLPCAPRTDSWIKQCFARIKKYVARFRKK